MVVDPASSRAQFRLQVAELASQSPLIGAWCERVAAGTAISDVALDRVTATGHALDSWVGVKKVFAATHAVLQGRDHALRQYVPTLGGQARTDGGFDDMLTGFVDDHLDEMLPLLPRMMVANDPSAGIAMWQAAAQVAPQGYALLCIGAAAGLELVADALEPSLTGRPVSRRGVDTAPIDVRDDLAARWLLGVCPPDDVQRFELTRRAIAAVVDGDIRVAAQDAVTAIESASAAVPLVVMGASVLCMLQDPTTVLDAVRHRLGVTYFVSDEAVAMHRRAGNGAGLEAHAPSDRVIRVQRYDDGEAETLA